MPVQTKANLQGYLAQGLAGVSELWNYKTKNWVTCVCAGDIEMMGRSRSLQVRVMAAYAY